MILDVYGHPYKILISLKPSAISCELYEVYYWEFMKKITLTVY